jgi:hypothetical protein
MIMDQVWELIELQRLGRLKPLRARLTSARITQPSTWSLIGPTACMKA